MLVPSLDSISYKRSKNNQKRKKFIEEFHDKSYHEAGLMVYRLYDENFKFDLENNIIYEYEIKNKH